MSGYAVAVRIERCTVRARGGSAAGPPTVAPAQVQVDIVDLSRPAAPPLADRLRDRLDALRDGLGQLTWYLVNPEGWR